MNANERHAIDVLARLVEGHPNTVAGVAEDCHGTYCVYCCRRGYEDRPRPDHGLDCPIEQGQRLLEHIYGDQDEPTTTIREIPVSLLG